MATLPAFNPGERLVIAGRTGSGKSTLGSFLLRRTRQHYLILNPKHTAAYAQLPEANVIRKFKASKIERSLKDNRFTVFNPGGSEAGADYMDSIIGWIHEDYKNVGLVADELYTLHSNGRPGPGLVSWLTRGRELKQSFMGFTQRPAWVSRFIFSEADYIVGMDLTLPEDRKRMRENTGYDGFSQRLSPHYWRWYDVKADADTLWGPVPLS